MGYSTDFTGEFDVTPTLKLEHRLYLSKFSETRRMRRSEKVVEQLPDPVRVAVSLPVGKDGSYFVGGTGICGQDHDPSVIDYNSSSSEQPGLWCKWEPNEEGTAIQWSGMEKFYHYTEWLQYLIKHFLLPWGYVLNGEVSWEGEDSSDQGVIFVKDNQVEAVPSTIKNSGPSWK